VYDGRPAAAFTYADEAVARSVAAAHSVVLSCTEPRSAGSHFTAMAITGRPRLVADPAGDVFVGELLDQELRKFPPSRLLADSPLLRREHWWYLPRLIVVLDVTTTDPLPARTGARDHLLVVTPSTAPSTEQAEAPVVRVASAPPVAVDEPPPAGEAVLFGQDASFPDLERWAQWRYRGRWDGQQLAVREEPTAVGPGATPSVWRRWRRQRDLEKRCRQALSSL